MPRTSKIDMLPIPVRRELVQRIVGNGYGQYRETAEWLSALGYKINKSTIHLFGQQLKAHRDDRVIEDLAHAQTESIESLNIRMRCIEAAVASGSHDVLHDAQKFLEWVNLKMD